MPTTTHAPTALATASRALRAAAGLLLLAAAAPAVAVPVLFSGVGPTAGAIGHGLVGANPGTEPAPFREDGSQMGAHPFAGAFNGIYTRLVSRDLFDTATGLERVLDDMQAPFGATAAAPHGLAAIGIAGPLHLSFNGQVLDVNAASDYFFEGNAGDPALLEHRIYRGGNLRIVEEIAPGSYQTVAEYEDFTSHIVIDWANGAAVSGTATGTVLGTSPTFLPFVYTFESGDAVDAEGITPLGGYGGFDIVAGFGFDFDTSPVPAPATGALLALALVPLAARRRRRLPR